MKKEKKEKNKLDFKRLQWNVDNFIGCTHKQHPQQSTLQESINTFGLVVRKYFQPAKKKKKTR
jgi:hypothetical protein